MRKQDDIRIVLGSERFAGSANVDGQVTINLSGDRRNLVQGDRASLVNIENIFEEERQESNIFRLSGKIVNIFDNTVSGTSIYTPFKNNLYLIDPEQSINTNVWRGFPQYDEFTLIRERGITNHLNYIPKSATSYNWMFNVTYTYSSTTDQTMSYTNENISSPTNVFNVSDGIPFVMKKGSLNGKKLVYFYCATNHNLTNGQSIELSTPINGKTIYTIYSIGDGTYKSNETIFSLFDLSFSNTEVFDGKTGNFKRIKDINNSGETKSKYYVRLHKVLTDNSETFITKMGFENNPFPNKRKLEYSGLTPNNVQRVSVKTGTQSYGFTVNPDIDVTNLIDNNGKPITELFLTIVNRGYAGWFNKPAPNTNKAIDIGWGFNFQKNSIDPWWNHNSLSNKDNINTVSYISQGYTFYYNRLLKKDDVIKGDFCEYNDYEQKEYVLSPIYHKYSINTNVFFDNSTNDYPSGYVYQPHNSIPIRVFSDYVETQNAENVANVPFYSYFSEKTNQFIWRDLYSYGYVDSENLGLNIPFTNNAHYPFKTINFLNYPVIRDVNAPTTSGYNEPTTDDCE
jgi:hypothetical protein